MSEHTKNPSGMADRALLIPQQESATFRAMVLNMDETPFGVGISQATRVLERGSKGKGKAGEASEGILRTTGMGDIN